MTGSCGKWMSITEYAESSGVSEDEARKSVQTGGFITKSQAGREYVWVDDPDHPQSREAGNGAANDAHDDGQALGASSDGKSPDRDADAMEGEALPARFSGADQLALQAERAISLVDRSLNTFMMMHEEVVREKERLIEMSRDGLDEREREIEDKQQRIEGLEQKIREIEQEMADLKMLVGILETRIEKLRGGQAVRSGPGEVSEKASVGDLMEEQLSYIMEDQMVQELLKE